MPLKNMRVAMLVEQQYQEMEIWYPLYRLREAGAKVVTVGPVAGGVYPSKVGYPCKAEMSWEAVVLRIWSISRVLRIAEAMVFIICSRAAWAFDSAISKLLASNCPRKRLAPRCATLDMWSQNRAQTNDTP